MGKGKSGFPIIGICDKCGQDSVPLSKYKGMYLCDQDLSLEKTILEAKNKNKREDTYKDRWAKLISLQGTPR